MSPSPTEIYRFDEFELHCGRRSFTRLGQKIPLAPKTFDVLSFLVANAGRVVLKDELLKAVWPESFVEDGNLTQHIFWLRKALAEFADYIVTIPGRGYQFTAQVQTVQTVDPRNPTPDPTPPAPATSQPARPAYWAYAIIIILICGLIGWSMRARINGAIPVIPGDHHEVVLADFDNSTGDPDFDPALKTLLAIDLDQSPYLVVASDSDTHNILQLMSRPAGSTLTPDLASEVCQRLNDQVVLSGLIARFGQKYLLTLTATDCQTGKSLVQSKSTADNREDVLKSLDTLAATMRTRLGESIKSHPNTTPPLQRAHTFSLEALQQYSQALALESTSHQRESVPLFQHAIELDPRFAAAYLWLAIAYGALGEGASARAAITRAYQLRDQGDDFLKLSITNQYNSIVTGDLRALQRNLTTWTQLYPNQPRPWLNLSSNLQDLALYQQAIEPARRAVALAPNEGHAYAALCHSLLSAGFVDDAKAACREAVRRHIATGFIHGQLRNIAYLQHDAASWATEVAWAKTTGEPSAYTAVNLFAQGKAHAAVALWLQHVALAREQGLLERAFIGESALLHRESDYQMDADLRQLLRHHGPRPWPFDRILADCELGRLAAADADLKFSTSLIKGAQPPASQLQDFSHDTMQTEFYYPQALAYIALARHHPEEAIADLEITRPLDDTSTEPILLRGSAYLAARQPALAEVEFRKIQDRPYLAIGTPFHPLAQLGLARALEMQGNHTAARQAYETLFILWKDADPDLPPLLKARKEYARIH